MTEAIIFAGIDEVVFAKIDMAHIGIADAIIEVELSAVNIPIEMSALLGKPITGGSAFPCVPGFQAVGIVKATGAHAALKPGERVFFTKSKLVSPFSDGNWMGAHVRYALIDASEKPTEGYWTRVPDNVDVECAIFSATSASSAYESSPLSHDENEKVMAELALGNLNFATKVSHRFKPGQAEDAYKMILGKPGDFEGVLFDWRG